MEAQSTKNNCHCFLLKKKVVGKLTKPQNIKIHTLILLSTRYKGGRGRGRKSLADIKMKHRCIENDFPIDFNRVNIIYTYP